MRYVCLLSIAFCALLPLPAWAALKVVATTTSMGMLAREVGGNQVKVTTLAPPDRDTHYLQAKPSMMLALRGADALVAVGADLEIGWLPAALNSSANPTIQEGSKGYFEAAQQVELIDKGIADRAQGDVHPQGNPHFQLDPVRLAKVAQALAKHFGKLDPEHQANYLKNSQKLATQLKQLTTELAAQTRGAPGVVLMHNSPDYLMTRLNVQVLGYLEPVPGIPPTAEHIKKLYAKLAGKKGVIIHAPYHPTKAAKKLAAQLGWPRYSLPIEPDKEANFSAYRALLLQWAKALAPTSTK